MNPIVKDVRIDYNGITIITEHIPGNILGKEYYCPFDTNIYFGKIVLVCVETGLKQDKFVIDNFNSKCVEFKLQEIEHEFYGFPPEQIEYWISKCGIFLRDNNKFNDL